MVGLPVSVPSCFSGAASHRAGWRVYQLGLMEGRSPYHPLPSMGPQEEMVLSRGPSWPGRAGGWAQTRVPSNVWPRII